MSKDPDADAAHTRRRTSPRAARRARRITLTLLILASVMLLALPLAPAHASWDGRPKVLLHVSSGIYKNPCGAGRQIGSCMANIRVAAGLDPPCCNRFVWLLVDRGNLPSFGSMECGIDYQDGRPGQSTDGQRLEVFSFSYCDPPSVAPPTGPFLFNVDPGTGLVASWDTTAVNQVAVVGYFYVAAYAQDTLQVTTHPTSGMARVSDRAGQAVTLDSRDLGSAVFSPTGQVAGCNPCLGACPGVTPVRSETWGGIKRSFRGS